MPHNTVEHNDEEQISLHPFVSEDKTKTAPQHEREPGDHKNPAELRKRAINPPWDLTIIVAHEIGLGAQRESPRGGKCGAEIKASFVPDSSEHSDCERNC